MSCAGNSNATKEALELKWKAEKELLELNDNRITVIKPGHVFSKEIFLSYLRGIYYRHKWSKNSNVPPLYHVFIKILFKQAVRTRELANVTLHAALDPSIHGLIEGEDIVIKGVGESSKYLFEYASEINDWKKYF